MIRFCSLLATLLLATTAIADVSGRIDVVDGDTIDIAGERVRLHGIDAPEIDQPCEDANGVPWMCGAFVRDAVTDLYQGRRGTCVEVDRDRYGRMVGKCYVDGQDINEQIVLAGWAEAYRRYSYDYDLAEKTAQVQGVGLWGSDMQSPAAFRADQRADQAAANAPTGDCIIKGNISGAGQIYHMPHNRDYDSTRINEAQGERWFCSEAEALAAGWRAARN
ncbi:MAG: thermonuclease family protein [Pseudomonadota bacterium]